MMSFLYQEQSPSVADDFILLTSQADGRIVVTADKDFGELVYRLGRASAGVILIRLAGISNVAKANMVSSAVYEHAIELPGSFTVLEPGRIRIRRSTD